MTPVRLGHAVALVDADVGVHRRAAASAALAASARRRTRPMRSEPSRSGRKSGCCRIMASIVGTNPQSVMACSSMASITAPGSKAGIITTVPPPAHGPKIPRLPATWNMARKMRKRKRVVELERHRHVVEAQSQVAMGQRHALGQARRAAGVHEDAQVVLGRLRRQPRRRPRPAAARSGRLCSRPAPPRASFTPSAWSSSTTGQVGGVAEHDVGARSPEGCRPARPG